MLYEISPKMIPMLSVVGKIVYQRGASSSTMVRTKKKNSLCIPPFDIGVLKRNIYSNTEKSKLVSNQFDCLTNFGFSQEEVELMLKNCGSIRNLSTETLISNVTIWMQCQFGEEMLLSLLKKHPYFLTVDYNKIEDRIKRLTSQFTNKYMYKILFNAPNVLTERWEVFQEKLDFLVNEKKISKAEVVNSGALSFNLHYIKERIEFLSRCGIFKVQNAKAVKAFTNPKLDVIVNSTDSSFARDVAKLSLFEYEVFQQLFSEDEVSEKGSDSE